MGFADYLILALVAGGVIAALGYMRRARRSGKGCCGNCSQCSGCRRD